jgi:hypothetical protein
VLEQRTGKQRGCDVRVGRASGIGQQPVVVRPGRGLSLEAQPIGAAQRQQGALREVAIGMPIARSVARYRDPIISAVDPGLGRCRGRARFHHWLLADAVVRDLLD